MALDLVFKLDGLVFVLLWGEGLGSLGFRASDFIADFRRKSREPTN